MKKQTLTKIISGLIVFVFVVSMFQFALPTQAANSSLSNAYANPNNGDNTYKFKIKDVVNSNLLTNIVGCTGIVNKVSTWMVKFIQSPKQQAKILKDKADKIKQQMISACASTKGGAQTAGGLIPWVNDLTSPINTMFSKINMKVLGMDVKACQEQVTATDPKEFQAIVEQNEQQSEVQLKEQCFDGIAITLAKNQLSAMTKSAMNWVNSGYGGDPFFVQNMTNLTNSIGNNVINTGIDALLSPLAGGENPYAKNFLTSTVQTQGLRSSSTKFLGGLTSDLENFISNPVSYYSGKTLSKAQKTEMALQRAQDANNAFAKDFSVGGWNGWLALTQTPQNNPLGFNMIASQYLADVQSQEVSKTQNELTQNNGFLSQKECVKWNDDEKKALQDDYDFNVGYEKDVCTESSPDFDEDGCTEAEGLTLQSKDKLASFVRECTPDGWKVTTPGSIIRDKTTNYLNSPERQLELAKTINDSLNALFSILISKLEGGGLSGLSDGVNNSSNWTDNLNVDINNFTSPDGNTTYDNNGAYDGFNLTRDLGNNYIYGELTDLGTWNANTNEATNTTYKELPSTFPAEVKTVKLYSETPPENYKPNDKTKVIEQVFPINAYYKVTTAGNEKLMIEGYNGWAVGDRAFWDGSKWGNWKCYKSTTTDKRGPCDNQINPIKKRGVIQIQQDYIVAGKEILKVLPSIMPKLGELDYCLPGPNPSYQTNSTDAQSAFSDWVNSSFIGPVDSSGERQGVKIDGPGEMFYENLHRIYSSDKIWGVISGGIPKTQGYKNTVQPDPDSLATIKYNGASNDLTMQELLMFFSNICNKNEEENLGKINYYTDDCYGNYLYKPEDAGLTNLNFKTIVQEYLNNFVNTYMFDTFYGIFDKEMDDTYFKKMTSKYNDTELIIGTEPNLAYVEMAAAGFDITKNITYYNDDTTKATADYTDAINQAKLNIAKLEPIRDEVSKIIKVAQDRRTAEMLKTLGKLGNQSKFDNCNQTQKQCLEEVNDSNIGFNAYVTKMNTYGCNIDNNICIIDLAGNEEQAKIDCQKKRDVCDIAFPTDKTGACVSKQISCLDPIKDKIITKFNKDNDAIIAKYKKDLEVCLAEENISFYDPEQIIGKTEAGKCDDGIDNDLNGLVDKEDPVCGGIEPFHVGPHVQPGRGGTIESGTRSSCHQGSKIDMTRSDLATYMQSLTATSHCAEQSTAECNNSFEAYNGILYQCIQ